jgi:hypothetical protein
MFLFALLKKIILVLLNKKVGKTAKKHPFLG